MCGIVGMMGPGISVNDWDVIDQLTYVSGLRGQHSTGVAQGYASVSKHYPTEFLIQKDVMSPANFMRYHRHHEQGNKKIMREVFNNFFMVHTRAATRGSINIENAHPFEFDNIIGMHNGTLVDEKYQHGEKTDSELLLKDINERGIIPVLKELDPHSAYALVIFDKNTGRMSFIRNALRPLSLCFNDNRGVMYWASEEWMLRDILARNGERVLGNKYPYFKPHHVYSVHPHEIKYKEEKVFDVEEFKPRPIVPITVSKPRIRLPAQIHQTANNATVNVLNWKARQEAKKEQGQKDVTKDVRKANFTVIEGGVNHSLSATSRIPAIHCVSCGKYMSLVDRHFATKFGGNTYIHSHCEDEVPFHLQADYYNNREEVKIN